MPSPIRTVVAVATMVLLLVVVLLGVAYCGERRERQRAEGQTRVAVGSQNAGKAAVEALQDQQKASDQSQELGRQNAQDIAGASNASDSAGDAGERAYRAWCKREQLRGKPLNDRCHRL